MHTMTIFGIDYAWGHPSTASMKALGVKFACRYLSYDTEGKTITPAEAQALAAAGIWIVAVWETSASRAKRGHAAGVSDAREALRQSNALGMLKDRPIYFAVDFDAGLGDWPEVREYFRGVNSVIGLGRTGMYGGYDPVRWGFDQGVIEWGWQTYAWSEGKWDARAELQQYRNGMRVGGKDCDFNRAMTEDYGQWMPSLSPVTPLPPPPVVPPSPDPPLTQPPVRKSSMCRTWQAQMAKRGWEIDVDGWYGPDSEAVCRAFQELHGLAVDGVVGPITWKAAWTRPTS